MGWESPSPVLAWKGCDKNSQTKPCRRAGFDVAHLVAHDRAASGIKPEVEYGLQDHSRIGLAPRVITAMGADAVHGMIGAMIDTGDRRTLGLEALAHPTCQLLISLLVEVAAADAGLVADDHDRPPQLVGPKPSQWENTRDELELLRAMDLAAIHVDYTVTVEKESPAGQVFSCFRTVLEWQREIICPIQHLGSYHGSSPDVTFA
jgi:hypothetical protein